MILGESVIWCWVAAFLFRRELSIDQSTGKLVTQTLRLLALLSQKLRDAAP